MTAREFFAAHDLCLNALQRAAVQSVAPEILTLAVPGSGKTTVLATRIAYLAEVHAVPLHKILALTFNLSLIHI